MAQIGPNDLAQLPCTSSNPGTGEIKRLLQQCAEPTATSIRLELIEKAMFVNPFLRKRYNVLVYARHSGMAAPCVGLAEGNDFYQCVYKGFAEAFERCVFIMTCDGAHSSNGCAAHPELSVACLNAFCELIERDVVLRSWYLKIKPAAILEPPASFTIVHRLGRYGFSVQFYQLLVDWENVEGLSVVLAIVRPAARHPLWRLLYPNAFGGRICGFGCSFSGWRAMWKAYREAVLNAWMVFLKPEIYSESYRLDAGNNRAHFLHYLNPQHAAAFEFLEGCYLPRLQLAEEDVGALDRGQRDMVRMVAFLERNRIAMQWSILSRPGGARPFFVVRALAPSLQDLWFGSSYTAMNSARLGPVESIRTTQPWPHPIA